jgi:HKD family nuclease
MHSFFGESQSPSSALFGAPEAFQFERWISTAASLQIAIAFGHISGWKKVEKAITSSVAERIEILLGQSFFQTEPDLLFALKKLRTSKKSLEVKLASSVTTFHPKMWIVNGSQAVIGSSNLSAGGLQANVECNVYVEQASAVVEMRDWFKDQWKTGHALDSPFFNLYVEQYRKVDDQRRMLRARLQSAQDILSAKEAKWRRAEALAKALEYWQSPEGRAAISDRGDAIAHMQGFLKLPTFDFEASDYQDFIRILELGRIRLSYIPQTIAMLPQLKAALKGLGTQPTSVSYDELSNIYGVGPNLATKLLATYDPQHFVVLNAPVERALLSFGFAQENLDPMNGQKYERFLKELKPFIEEAEIQNLIPAAALDAFFYYYRG